MLKWTDLARTENTTSVLLMAAILYVFRDQFLMPAIVLAGLWYSYNYVQTSVEARWKAASIDDDEDKLLAKLKQNVVSQQSGGDLRDHPLNDVNPNVFEYGKGECGKPETPQSDDSFERKVQDSIQGNADLGHYVYQVPDPSGCGRSPFAFEIMEKTQTAANGESQQQDEYRKADRNNELGGARRCSTRNCY